MPLLVLGLVGCRCCKTILAKGMDGLQDRMPRIRGGLFFRVLHSEGVYRNHPNVGAVDTGAKRLS